MFRALPLKVKRENTKLGGFLGADDGDNVLMLVVMVMVMICSDGDYGDESSLMMVMVMIMVVVMMVMLIVMMMVMGSSWSVLGGNCIRNLVIAGTRASWVDWK